MPCAKTVKFSRVTYSMEPALARNVRGVMIVNFAAGRRVDAVASTGRAFEKRSERLPRVERYKCRKFRRMYCGGENVVDSGKR